MERRLHLAQLRFGELLSGWMNGCRLLHLANNPVLPTLRVLRGFAPGLHKLHACCARHPPSGARAPQTWRSGDADPRCAVLYV